MTMPADAPAWLRDILTELARAQAQAERQIATLAAAQAQTTILVAQHGERLDRIDKLLAQQAELLATLAAAAQQTNERLGRVETGLVGVGSRLDGVETRLGGVEDRLGGVENRLGETTGWVWEVRSRDRAARFLRGIAVAVRPLTEAELNSLLDQATNAGALSPADAAEIRLADRICDAADLDIGAPLRVLAEVSARVATHDVARAAARAALLSTLGIPTVAVVIGQRLDRDAEQQAQVAGVRTVINPDK